MQMVHRSDLVSTPTQFPDLRRKLVEAGEVFDWVDPLVLSTTHLPAVTQAPIPENRLLRPMPVSSRYPLRRVRTAQIAHGHYANVYDLIDWCSNNPTSITDVRFVVLGTEFHDMSTGTPRTMHASVYCTIDEYVGVRFELIELPPVLTEPTIFIRIAKF